MTKKLKILIVRLSAIGDVIHSLPILHALKRKFPESQIGWAVEDRAADLIINNPLINTVHIIPKQKWKNNKNKFDNVEEFISIVKSIRAEKYDIAIDLQELFKSGIITYLSGAKRRIAHAKTREFADLFVNEKLKAHDIFDPNKMIIDRYLEPAAYLGAPVDEIKFSLPAVTDETKVAVDKLLNKIDLNKPIIVFIPGTIWPTKHWLDEYWATLTKNLSKQNNIIFIGSKRENDLIARITSDSKPEDFINLAGKTTLLELIEVFKRCDIVVATDTGPTHIANAAEKPSIITIFGATSFKRSCPYGEKHIALSAELSCQPCFKRQCKRKDSLMECMKVITPDIVLKKINEKLTFVY